MVKKDALVVLKGFSESKLRLDYKEEMEKRAEAMKETLYKELNDMTEMSIHTVWRKMALYIAEIEKESKQIFGKIEGGDIVCDQVGVDIRTRHNNICKAVAEDFNKNQSMHDIIRSKINYLEGIVTYPEKLMEIEEAEQEKERAEHEIKALQALQEAETD